MSSTLYPEEHLDPDDDDGTIVNNKSELEKLVVGHRIVSAEYGSVSMQELDYDENGRICGSYVYSSERKGDLSGFVLTLDNGQRVILRNTSDCCALTELNAFILHADKVDHIITGIGTTDGYQTWHIYADMGDVLELTVDWTAGNPFYYGYGFDLNVTALPPVPPTPTDGTPRKGDPVVFTPLQRP